MQAFNPCGSAPPSSDTVIWAPLAHLLCPPLAQLWGEKAHRWLSKDQSRAPHAALVFLVRKRVEFLLCTLQSC